MLVLGIEPSYGETGIILYDIHSGPRAHTLYSQIMMRHEYGDAVPELAPCDHIRRVIPLLEEVFGKAGTTRVDIDAIVYTKGPRLAGALLVDALVANALASALGKPLVAMHYLEGHLLSSSLGAGQLEFPFLAPFVSGEHTQLMRVDAVGQYTLLGGTLGDAAGEAFDKTVKLPGLGYPGGPAVPCLAEFGDLGVFDPPRPILYLGNSDFSFTDLKTAVLTQVRRLNLTDSGACYQLRADFARAFVDTIVEVPVRKTLCATHEHGSKRTVAAGRVGTNRQLREGLSAEGKKRGLHVYYPGLQLCTDDGAMIVFVGAMWLQTDPAQVQGDYGYGVTPRWGLEDIRVRHV